MAPLIGIPCRRCQEDPADRPIEGVRYPYVQEVSRAGAIPFLIPLLTKSEHLHELYMHADGILLAGGADIQPKHYGEEPRTQLFTNPLRDEIELQFVRWCLEDKKPIFGICRGMQLLNVATGGTLYQDIKTDRGAASGAIHTPGKQEDKKQRWRELRHELHIEASSLLAKALGESSIPINSIHHQSIKSLGENVRITARSQDELIEGIEIEEHPFAIGLQAHPEAIAADVDTRWQKVFSAFSDAAKAYADKR